MSFTCPAGHQSQAGDYCDVCGMPIAAQASSAPDATGSAPPAGGGEAGSSAAPAGALAGAPVGAPAGAGSAAAPPAGPGAPDAGAAGSTQVCPNCSAENPADALFCEACGYDFTTGTLPRPAETPQAGVETPAASSGGSLDLDAPSSEGAPAAPGATAMAPATPPAAPSATPPEWVAEVWVDPDWYDVQSSDEPMPSAGLPVVVPLHGRSILVGRPSASRGITPDIDCSSDTGVSRRQAQLTTDGSRWFVEDLQSSNGTWVGPASGPLPTDPIPPGQRRELDEDDRIYVGAWTRLVVRRATAEDQAATA